MKSGVKFIKPDFTRNIINISATFAEFLGCPNDKPTLPKLEKELKKGYKNVVFLLFDGMGVTPLEVNLKPDSLLRRNVAQILTSVFPSTTANATSTLISNKYPMEHGWFGWSVYFEELDRAVDLFLSRDSYTHEKLAPDFVRKRLPFEPFYKYANSSYAISKVVPSFWYDGDENGFYPADDPDSLFSNVKKICQRDGRQFVYSYSVYPDETMHEFGVSSNEAKAVIERIERGVAELCGSLDDTLLVISADHGQTDVGGYCELREDRELLSLLRCPPYLEARATAFKVKEGLFGEFERLFNAKYGEDFVLFKSADLIAENYFGGNIINENARLLGDYIAVCKTDKTMLLTPFSHRYKGHHTSLTAEMEVPLILIPLP